VIVKLEPRNPGVKLMIHDELEGTTEVICVDCGNHWTVMHDTLESDYAEEDNVTECKRCKDPVRPFNMSPVIGHA
jgi:hypothetical protein